MPCRSTQTLLSQVGGEFTRAWKVKEILPLAALNIGLPTADIYTDLYMVIKLWSNGHPRWAGCLLAPLLLNYILTWIIWSKLKTRARVSWIPVFFSCYPQFCAGKVIHKLWNDPVNGIKEKRRFEREVSEMEVFTEAVPTTLILTYLMVQGLLNEGDPSRLSPGSLGALLIGEDYCFENRELGRKQCNSWYISPDYYMFFVSYTTSIISSSMGLAKCLKIGPCRILAQSGFCTSRFALLFFSMCFTLDSKGLALGFALGDPNLKGSGSLVALVTMFLPGLLLAMFSICRYRQTVRDVLAHPSLLLLPLVTNYTFAFAKRKSETHVVFSRWWTFVNLGLSLLGNIAYCLAVYLLVDGKPVLLTVNGLPRLEAWRYYLFVIPVPILGAVLTLLFLTLDSCSCCALSPDLQFAVLRPTDPMVEYVLDSKAESKKVVLSELLSGENQLTSITVQPEA